MDVVTYAAAVGAAKKYTDEQIGSDDAVKYTEQSLTTAQQAQARTNIGAAASTDIPIDAVKYTEQTLTDAQKTQARTNIGAGTSSFSGRYSDLTDAPPLVKGTGTGGNTVGGTGGTAMNSAKNLNSYAYGYLAGAYANYAFAFGDRAFAGNSNRNTGKHAVAIGNNVSAEKDYEIAYGKFNQSNADTAFSIGDGTSDSDRHNLMELKTDGTLLLNGNAVKTEGDDNKLRLGQILAMKFTSNSSTNHAPKYGFNDLFSSSNTAIVFSSSKTYTVTANTIKVYQFGDFVAFESSGGVYVYPILGKVGYPTTGEWIKVENCYKMFYACENITSLNLSMFDTSEVTNMSYMFYDCSGVTSVDLSSFDTSKVMDMRYMFEKCPALIYLDLSQFDMSNVVYYDRFFGFGSGVSAAGITTLKTPKINPHDDIPLPRTLYSQDGTAYTNLPVTTGTSIELRQSWT